MDLSVISVVCFFAIVAFCGAVMMVIRDLVITGDGSAGIGLGLGRGRSFRRTPNVFDEKPAQSITGRIDQAFDRLILESGQEMSSMTAFLMLLASGLFIGGILFIYYDNFGIGSMGMAVGMFVPLLIWMYYRGKRLKEIQEQLPHVIDLMARAVRAGESVDQAVELIGSESRGVLAQEFARCSRQMQMGLSLSSAMKNLSRRNRLMELRMMVTTLLVHRQTGGNLPVALERMANVVRDRLNYRRQMKASTGAGRTSTMLIAILSPIVYIIMFLFQPEHVSVLLEDPVGKTLMVVAVTLEIIGVLWVVHMLRHDY
ncbi:MAG: type II secretion system F family protein [Planctomycetota bacterium]|nr:type II secretion system F family protein [Planctomycetota bacterium]MDA1211096.1 type II secretion system F family protein [Planctomycetota bacterium]